MEDLSHSCVVDVGRQPLDADQLATEFFETEAELDAATGDGAFRGEAPEDLFSAPAQRSRFRPRSPPPSRALTGSNIMLRSRAPCNFGLTTLARK